MALVTVYVFSLNSPTYLDHQWVIDPKDYWDIALDVPNEHFLPFDRDEHYGLHD